MNTIPHPPVFDGHNDLLLRLWLHDAADPAALFLDGSLEGHLDLRRCRLGGFAGGLFAIFVPPASYMSQLKPNSPAVPHDALAITQAQISLLERIETQSSGRAKICRTVAEIEQCIAHDVLAMVMHIEGAEAIDADLYNLDVLYSMGLRSLGPVWSRPNIFGHGVPFKYQQTPNVRHKRRH